MLQQVAISGNRVVALGQATTGTGPGASTVPFAEVSFDQFTVLVAAFAPPATERVIKTVPTSPAAKAILSLFENTPNAS